MSAESYCFAMWAAGDVEAFCHRPLGHPGPHVASIAEEVEWED